MSCNLCPLALPAQVTAHAPPHPRLIIIGDWPNTDDEQKREPFAVGSNPKRDYANAVIRRVAAGIGLDWETSVYAAYALRCNVDHRAVKLKIKPQYLVTCRTQHLEPNLKDVDCPLVLVMGETALKSLLPELKGGVFKARCQWHEAVVGGRRRLLRVTFACDYVQKMSMYRAEVVGNKVVRGERWNPPGSVGALFLDDVRAVRAKIKELYGKRATA